MIFTRHNESKSDRGETVNNLTYCVNEWGRVEAGKDSKDTKIIKKYKGENVVESHDRQLPGGSRHIEENLV